MSVDEVPASANEVTASANEVTDKARFIGRENVACPYRELGWSTFVWKGRPRTQPFQVKHGAGVSILPHAGHEQARGPVTITGRCEVIAGLSIQARNKCLISRRPTPPFFYSRRGGARVAGGTEEKSFLPLGFTLLRLEECNGTVPFRGLVIVDNGRPY